MLSIMTMAVIAAGPLLPDAVPAAIDRHAPNLIQHAQEPLANRPRWGEQMSAPSSGQLPVTPLPKSLGPYVRTGGVVALKARTS